VKHESVRRTTLTYRGIQCLADEFGGHPLAQCEPIRHYVIDLGPGAGDEGGKVVISGTPEFVARGGRGKTAQYLR
jgi:hypothetical protein